MEKELQKRYEYIKELICDRYKTYIDRNGVNFYHHLTSNEKILEKLINSHTSKGHEIKCINFDYINTIKAKIYSLLHSALIDEVLTTDEFNTLFSDDEKIFMTEYSKLCRINDTCYLMDTHEISHYMRLVFLADVRFHTDILIFDNITKNDLKSLFFWHETYKKIMNK